MIRKRGIKRKPRNPFFIRKRVCRFCSGKMGKIDYKDLKTLEFFLKERSRMVSSRSSGNCAKHQRQVVEAIKRARFLSLLPYCSYR